MFYCHRRAQTQTHIRDVFLEGDSDNERAKNTSNPIRKIVDAMRSDKVSEKSFLPLSIGDPTIDGNLLPPPNVDEALKKTIDSHKANGYPPSVGFPASRDAIARYWRNNFMDQIPEAERPHLVKGETCVITSGASHALEMAICAVCGVGDSLLLPDPRP